MLSEETNPNLGELMADFQKAALNAFSKKFLSKQSRAVISTRRNLSTGKSMRSDWNFLTKSFPNLT